MSTRQPLRHKALFAIEYLGNRYVQRGLVMKEPPIGNGLWGIKARGRWRHERSLGLHNLSRKQLAMHFSNNRYY